MKLSWIKPIAAGGSAAAATIAVVVYVDVSNDWPAEPVIVVAVTTIAWLLYIIAEGRETKGTSLARRPSASWSDVDDAVLELKKACSGYKPTVIVGISRGGMIVADLLGKHFSGQLPVVAVPYTRTENHDVVIPNKLFNLDLSDHRVLLVDDCVIGGTTLKKVREHLENECNGKDIKTGVLSVLERHRTEGLVNYWGKLSIKETPYYFPWGQA